MDVIDNKIRDLLIDGQKRREIASALGISMSSVSARINRNIKKIPRHRVIKNNPSPLLPLVWDNKEWFVEHYITKHIGIGRIAYMIGRANGTVVKRLLRYGIQINKNNVSNTAIRPSLSWVEKYYLTEKWSVTKCATKLNISQNSFSQALIELGIVQRNVGEQLKELWCAMPEDKKQYMRKVSKLAWNSEKRSAASARTSKLIQNGKCHSLHILYDNVRFRSSWEYELAKAFDVAKLRWKYESITIPYKYDGCDFNFVVDFLVNDNILIECKSPHLIKRHREQKKIEALREYCDDKNMQCFIITALCQIPCVISGLLS
ncbi:MAG: hypothetical protein M0R50_11750 [Candidatus Cloacimonetes bacterium]|jgi:hypothetical protein|nr:hypothetical protein [Candidatus Cloacimonadota bacterium]